MRNRKILSWIIDTSCANVTLSVVEYIVFTRLLSTGTVFVATSNRAPTDLNQEHYFWPSKGISLEKFEENWHEVTNQLGEQITSSTISVMFGRKLEVLESYDGVARFSFEYLCGRAFLSREMDRLMCVWVMRYMRDIVYDQDIKSFIPKWHTKSGL